MKLVLVTTLLCAVNAPFISLAHATIETGTFTGTVASGSDILGLFGQPGPAVGDAVYGTMAINYANFPIGNANWADASVYGGNGVSVTYYLDGASFTQTPSHATVDYYATKCCTSYSSASYQSSGALSGTTSTGTLITIPITSLLPDNFSAYQTFSSTGGTVTLSEHSGSLSSTLTINLTAFELGGTPLPGHANPTDVPEPSSITMLGVSLLGVGFAASLTKRLSSGRSVAV